MLIAVDRGDGSPFDIVQGAQRLSRQFDIGTHPDVTGKFRTKDIRCCRADPATAEKLGGLAVRILLKDGVAESIEQLSTYDIANGVGNSYTEFGPQGLVP